MSSPHWHPHGPHQGGPHPLNGGRVPEGPSYPAVPRGEPGRPGNAPTPAGFGLRLTARLIDYLLAAFTALLFFMLMAGLVAVLTGNPDGTDGEVNVWIFLFFFGWGVLLFFYDWLYLVTWGRTLGKMIVGIKVIDAGGGDRLGQKQAVVRSSLFCLPQTLPCLGNIVSLGLAMGMLSDDRARAVHDRAAGTLVVKTR